MRAGRVRGDATGGKAKAVKARGATTGKPKRKAKGKPARRRRRTREEIRERKARYRATRAALKRQLANELSLSAEVAQSNATVPYASKQEEAAARQQTLTAFIEAVRPQLPALMQSLKKIGDPRDAKKIEHQSALVFFYGMLCFVLHASSRREANRELTGPVLLEHLQQYFPELKRLPHQDTVNRLLCMTDVEKLQDLHVEMIRRLVRNKKFDRFLVNGRYPVAIDGTQKLVREELLSPEWQERTVAKGTDGEKTQYYVYVLEAALSLPNGMTLPLLSEFLNYEKGDTERAKQDCETKAFKRLTKRLRAEFPRLAITLVLDGLYPNGPVFEICRKYHWEFMIVLQDASLPLVWDEFERLSKLEDDACLTMTWNGRRQMFRWVNHIEHCFGDNGKKRQKVHVVECRESWEEIDPTTHDQVTKTSRHVWVSSEPLAKTNVHERCNLAARHRWNIEEQNLIEKRQGYQYEHCFSHNWEAMKGYHYLMHLAHALNVLAQYSEALIDVVRRMGVRPFIKFIRESLVHPWLEAEKVAKALSPTAQLRLA